MGACAFGGNLIVDTEETFTRCTLQSDAPILEMIDLASLPAMLAAEVQVLLAEIRGHSIEDLVDDETRLMEVDPFQLYRTCLIESRERLADFEHQAMESCTKLWNFIWLKFRC